MRVAAVAATSDLNLQAHVPSLFACMHGRCKELLLGAPIQLVAIAASWSLKQEAHDKTRHRQQAVELTVGAPQCLS